jgi:phosphopantothenoylcysteine decarboxylase/phosphopantothenate--cysteine ligase
VSVAPPTGCREIDIISAEEMYKEALAHLPEATVFIGAAAVADYRPKNIGGQKIKKTDSESLELELERTEDILSEISRRRSGKQLVIGFAAETQSVIEYGRKKLSAKNLDMVIANDVSKKEKGFDSDYNEGTLITKETEVEIPLTTKRAMADRILDEIICLKEKK